MPNRKVGKNHRKDDLESYLNLEMNSTEKLDRFIKSTGKNNLYTERVKLFRSVVAKRGLIDVHHKIEEK
jgi:hypothetical protein